MQILTTKSQVIDFCQNLDSLALIPTMGALHKGHLSLIEAAKADNNRHIIVSIFVNPTQFGENEDFDTYPRTNEKDIDLCQKAGVSAVFLPSVNEMYAEDEITLNPPKNMGYILEGFERVSHFAGVLQVVLKLFNLIKPHKAYFGRKDAQQVLILQKMIRDLFLPLEIVDCPIVRDTDGLALSSRNVYLSAKERAIALKIPKSIESVANAIKMGETRVEVLQGIALEILQCEDLKINYAVIYDRNLQPITHIIKNHSIFLIAAQVGRTRLIDNLWI